MALPHADARQRQREVHPRPECSPIILEPLVQAARTCGCGVDDYGSVQDFVRRCFRAAGKTEPVDQTPLKCLWGAGWPRSERAGGLVFRNGQHQEHSAK